MAATIYRVRVRHTRYSGEDQIYLLKGRTCADAERKALKLMKQRCRDYKMTPRGVYASNVETVGELDE